MRRKPHPDRVTDRIWAGLATHVSETPPRPVLDQVDGDWRPAFALNASRTQPVMPSA